MKSQGGFGLAEGIIVVALVCLAIFIGQHVIQKDHFATGTIEVHGQGCHTLVHAGDRFSSKSTGKVYKAISDAKIASYGCGNGPTTFDIIGTAVKVKAEKAGSQYNTDTELTYYDIDASNQILGEGSGMSDGN